MPPKKSAPKTISVFMRVRPNNTREIELGCGNDNLEYEDDKTVMIRRNKNEAPKRFPFHGVFKPDSRQEDVYKAYASTAVDAAFEGMHGILFVYGQTGSGKTFTISNHDDKNPELDGVLQRSMHEMWTRISADEDHTYRCTVSYVQLYNELLSDLIVDKGKEKEARVRMQMGPEGLGDVILLNETTGKTVEKEVRNYDDTISMFSLGQDRKEVASTNMNAVSSRSHVVFTFHVYKSTKSATGDINAPVKSALEGRLVICDLAGSERISKTGAKGDRLQEAASINKSLLVLGNVVKALTDKTAQHAPFRESKLTRLLQYSLQGNGCTSLIINCSPSNDNTEETISTIGFGQRALQIKQDAKRHEVVDYKALYQQLQAQLDRQQDNALEDAMREERAAYEEKISMLKDRIRQLEEENTLLQNDPDSINNASPTDLQAATSADLTVSKAQFADPAALASAPTGTFSDKGWKNIVMSLRATIEDRETKVQTKEEERLKMARLLQEEQAKSFGLGRKLFSLAVRLKEDRSRSANELDMVQAQLAAARGTEYLSIAGTVPDSESQMDLMTPRTAGVPDLSPGDTPRDGRMSPATPLDGAAGEQLNSLQRDLDKSHSAIRAMKQERIDLIVYQTMAQKAIHYLAAQSGYQRK